MAEQDQTEFRFEDGTIIRGNLILSYPLQNQDRSVILIESDSDKLDEWNYSFIYNDDTVIDISRLREKFGTIYDKIESKKHLPHNRNAFHLPSMIRHFERLPEFGNMFWYLMEKVFEIRMYGKLRNRYCEDRKETYVNSCIDEVVRYHSTFKDALETGLHKTQELKRRLRYTANITLNGSVLLYFQPIKDMEDYAPLIFADMDLERGGNHLREHSQSFWSIWSKLGYDRNRIFRASPEELADVVEILF